MLDPQKHDALVYSPIGATPIVWIDLGAPGGPRQARRWRRDTLAIVGGLDATGACPPIDPDGYDLLLTGRPHAPAPWVSVPDVHRAAASIGAAVARAPFAASVATQVARIGAGLDVAAAFQVESLGYSTLLGGAEFRAWLARHRVPPREPSSLPFLWVDRVADIVTITLARPDTRNAICAGMRDALWGALHAVIDDPSMPAVVLRGDGACFSIGGDLAEFGTATDLAQAHAVRTLRSCALLLHDLGARATVELHGACIGAGLEIPAAAARRIAKAGAFFQLPELSMGLMPGAGGTVTVSRAIGRHRACYMMLSGRRIARDLAVRWGLVAAAA